MLALVVLMLASSCTDQRQADISPAPTGPAASAAAKGRHPALVTRVIDGDTIEALLGNRDLDVRLIGIDTPETVAPDRAVECGGPAASRFTERRLDGERVELEFDVERLDRYGRTLAYVWLGGRLFNRVLVARGFARVATYPPNVRYVDVFLAAQHHARTESRGLWRLCTDTPTDLVAGGTPSG